MMELYDPVDYQPPVPTDVLCRDANTLPKELIFSLGEDLEGHQGALTDELGLTQESSLAHALYNWCQLQGSTIFVLRGVLVELGRRDLAQRLVYEMQTMILYVLIEEIDVDTNDVVARFSKVPTNCGMSLAFALENVLWDDLSNYKIIGPKENLSWTTPSHELKGKQLTIRHLRFKTDKALYGHSANVDAACNVKSLTVKTQPIQQKEGLTEFTLTGPHSVGYSYNHISDDDTPVKKPHTMPRDFNIPPWGSNEQMDNLKQPHISRAQSSESEINNIAALNTPISPSPSTSVSMIGQIGTSHQGTSLSFTSRDDEFSVDDETLVKVRVDTASHNNVNARRNLESEGNLGENDLGNPGYGAQNQLIEPVNEECEQNDLNLSRTTVKDVPCNPTIGLADLVESMDFVTKDDSVSNDVHMDSGEAEEPRFNCDPNKRSNINFYSEFPPVVSYMTEDSKISNQRADGWNDPKSLNLDPKAIVDAHIISDDEDIQQSIEESAEEEAKALKFKPTASYSGKGIAVKEQERILKQFVPNSHMEQQPQFSPSSEINDFTTFPTFSKPSPIVHTPPPQLVSPQGIKPSDFLDVTVMPGLDFPSSCHPVNFDPRGVLAPSKNPFVPVVVHHPSNVNVPRAMPPASLPNQPTTKEPEQHSPVSRRHLPGQKPLSRAISEPPLRSPRDIPQRNYENSPYLTPVEDGRSIQRPKPFLPPSRGESVSETIVNEDYNYIDPRLIQQIPSRPPPVPSRVQYYPPRMSLDDQTARIPGWCRDETDGTIERTMQDFRGHNGYFIVWKSQRKNRYIISVSHNNELIHFLIEEQRVDSSSERVIYYLYNGGFRSESLLELVNHYICCGVKRRLNDSPIGTKTYACEHIPLRRPLRVKFIKKSK